MSLAQVRAVERTEVRPPRPWWPRGAPRVTPSHARPPPDNAGLASVVDPNRQPRHALPWPVSAPRHRIAERLSCERVQVGAAAARCRPRPGYPTGFVQGARMGSRKRPRGSRLQPKPGLHVCGQCGPRGRHSVRTPACEGRGQFLIAQEPLGGPRDGLQRGFPRGGVRPAVRSAKRDHETREAIFGCASRGTLVRERRTGGALRSGQPDAHPSRSSL